MLPVHRFARRVRAHVQPRSRQQQPSVLGGHVVVMVVVHRPMVLTVLVPRVAGMVVVRIEVGSGGTVMPPSRSAVVLTVPEGGGEVSR